jgi:hypothetical protein
VRSRENVLGVILLALLSLGAAPQAPSTSFKATIEGTVREASTDQRLQGVKVYVLDPARQGPQPNSVFAVTDARGNFAIDVDQPRRYRLFPQQDGFVFARPQRLQRPYPGVVLAVAKEGVSRADLAMVREGSLSGQLLDPSGNALSGVYVNLYTRVYDDQGRLIWNTLGPLAQPRPGPTNDRGEYRFYGLQPGEYIVGAPGPIAAPTRYHPGVDDLARATPIQVNAGEETRVSPMTTNPPTKTVQVRFPYEDPERKFRSKSVMTTDGSQVFGIFSWGPVESEFVFAMAPGHYDLMLGATSPNGDLIFARTAVDVGNEDIRRDVPFTPGLRVTGSLKLMDTAGKSLDATGIRCYLLPQSEAATAQSGAPGCIGGQVSPARYRLEIPSMPADAYVASARSEDRDVLAEGLRIERDTNLDIVLSTPGAVIAGRVTNAKGEHLSHAVVALVPDAPLRDATVLYRSDASTYDGTFELRGVAPGVYHLFAWPDLPGFAYRNAEFMKKYENRGIPVRIDSVKSLSIDLTALE